MPRDSRALFPAGDRTRHGTRMSRTSRCSHGLCSSPRENGARPIVGTANRPFPEGDSTPWFPRDPARRAPGRCQPVGRAAPCGPAVLPRGFFTRTRFDLFEAMRSCRLPDWK
jgi:hypothetical protein